MTDRENALAEALAHAEDPIEEHILIFHPVCGGIITGAREYRCHECGRRFTADELRELVA